MSYYNINIPKTTTFDSFISRLAGFIRLVVLIGLGLFLAGWVASSTAVYLINNFTVQEVMK